MLVGVVAAAGCDVVFVARRSHDLVHVIDGDDGLLDGGGDTRSVATGTRRRRDFIADRWLTGRAVVTTS